MSFAHLIRHGDPDVRPQDDLYFHVNGGFLGSASIPPDRDGVGVMFEVHDRVRRDLEHIVATLGTGHARGTSAQLVGDFYASFTDVTRLAAQGNKTIDDLLKEVMRFDTPRQLSARLGLLMRYRLNSVLNVQVIVNRNDPTRYLPAFSQGGLGLPGPDHFLKDEHAWLREAYVCHMERQLVAAGLVDAKTIAKKVLRLETDLAFLHADATATRDVGSNYHPMSFSQVQIMTKNLAWIPMLYEIGLGVESDPTLVIVQPDFVRGVDKLLNEERLDEWRCWLAWRIIQGLADYASPSIASEHWRFIDLTVGGMTAIRPRGTRALSHIECYLGEAMGQIYVERHFRSEALRGIVDLIQSIVEEYRHTLKDVYWMTTPTRKSALDKLERLTYRIGYPHQWHDYRTLDIQPDDLVGNALRASNHLTESAIARLLGYCNGEDWQVPAHVVNAYYDMSRNEIVFPAAFLQPPFFDPEAESAVNYGAIGTIVAHEISHAFDDRGSCFDGEGRFREWWSSHDREAFLRLRARFVQQLNRIPSPQLPGIYLDGELTVSEAMSDLGGLVVSYRAWRRASSDAPDGGFKAAAQRFFFSHAGIWRHKEIVEESRYRIANDPHPPSEIRCNLTVRNFDPFYAAFGVRPGDGMWLRPGERLTLW